jgi:hypothetical protein
VITALQRDPDQRFQNAGAMRVALTTEVRRLRMGVSCGQIRDWVEWAFKQEPRSEATLETALLTPSVSNSMPFVDEAPTIDVKRKSPASREASKSPWGTTPSPVIVKRARPPRWNPPTRWMREPRRVSASPFVLLALIAFAALAVANGWIDVDAWRALLS